MKKVNGFTVYEENDPCALDEYSGQMAEDLNAELGKKVDKVAGKSLMSDTEILRLAGVNNYDDTEIKEEIAELQQENEYLSKNQLYDTKKGNNVTLEGVAEGNRNSTDVFGCCEQKSYSGKNKLDYSIVSVNVRASLDIINDEVIITRVAEGGTVVSFRVEGLEVGEIYTVRSNSRITLYSDRVYGTAYSSTDNASNGHQFTAQQDWYFVSIIINSGDIPNIGDQLNCGKIQLEKGPVVTDWEPYVGGQASPNPDYPQEIKRLRGRNRFSGFYRTVEDESHGSYKDETYTNSTRTGAETWVYKQKIRANEKLTISYQSKINAELRYVLSNENISSSADIVSATTTTINSPTIIDNADGFAYLYISFRVALNAETASVSKLQIEEGSAATEYEPYNTLTFKRKGKNILNSRFTSNSSNGITCERQQDGSYVLNGTSTAPVAFQTENSNYSLKAGEYTLDCGSLIPAGVTYTLFYGTNNTLAQIRLSNKSTTFTVDSDTDFSNFRDYLWIASGVTLNNFVIKPMLVKGTEVGDYEPYQEQTYQFNLNSNHFDGEFEQGTMNIETGALVTNPGIRTVNYQPIKPNTTYTLSGQAATRWAIFYNINKEYLGYQNITLGSDNAESGEFTAPANACYMKWYQVKKTDTTVEEKLQPKGAEELCAIKTTDSSLANYIDENGQMWIADYFAEDGIHKKVLIDTYDGSADENIWAYNSTYDNAYCYQIENSNFALIPINSVNYKHSLCSHFTNVYSAWGFLSSKAGTYSDHGTVHRKYFMSDKPTVAEFKSWLQANPIELAYVLDEEIIIPYTEEQAEQYAALHKVYMSEGTNNIYCTNDLAKNMQTTYVQSLQYVIDEIRNAIVAEGSESNV